MDDREFYAPPEYPRGGEEFRPAAEEFSGAGMRGEYNESGGKAASPAEEKQGSLHRALKRMMLAPVTAVAAAVVVVLSSYGVDPLGSDFLASRDPGHEIHYTVSEAPVEVLAEVGTWRSEDGVYWAYFDPSGSGWWFDGEYFGRFTWEKAGRSMVRYNGSAIYPERGTRLSEGALARVGVHGTFMVVEDSGGYAVSMGTALTRDDVLDFRPASSAIPADDAWLRRTMGMDTLEEMLDCTFWGTRQGWEEELSGAGVLWKEMEFLSGTTADAAAVFYKDGTEGESGSCSMGLGGLTNRELPSGMLTLEDALVLKEPSDRGGAAEHRFTAGTSVMCDLVLTADGPVLLVQAMGGVSGWSYVPMELRGYGLGGPSGDEEYWPPCYDEYPDDAFPDLPNLEPNGYVEGYGVLNEQYIRLQDGTEDLFLYAGSAYPGSTVTVPGARYDERTNTLTLENFTGGLLNVNLMGNGFKIRLVGENTLTGVLVWGFNYGGSVTFTGDGSLTVTRSGIELRAECSQSCVMVDRDVTLEVNGGVTVTDTWLEKSIYYLAPLELWGGVRQNIRDMSGVWYGMIIEPMADMAAEYVRFGR